MKKYNKPMKIIAPILFVAMTYTSQAHAENLEKLLVGKSAELQMKLTTDLPASRLPDGVSFRQNEGTNIAEFTKKGSKNKRKFIWKMMAENFCMKPLLAPVSDFACYKVSKKENVVKLTTLSESKDQPKQMIFTLNSK